MLGPSCALPGARSEEVHALRLLAEQASKGIDYRTLGQGWTQQHPTDRLAYREAQTGSLSHPASRQRSARSVEALKEACGRGEAGLRQAVARHFVREIGAEAVLGEGEEPSFEGVLAALEGELLLPLRSLNEAQQAMHRTFTGSPVPPDRVAEAVAAITRSVLFNNFREWRYSNPVGRRQLEGLSVRQISLWSEAKSTTDASGIRVHEDEPNELGLFWATKIGGPSHGFDIEGQCLLPLLANARHKVVLVSDPAYPHHPVGRAHFRLLWNEGGLPTLWLETLNADFRARVDSGPWLALVLAHAMAKADAMGARLSCEPGLEAALVNARGRGRVMMFQERLVLRPSNGVVEASDYLSWRHDWVQLEEELTPFIRRAIYTPESDRGEL